MRLLFCIKGDKNVVLLLVSSKGTGLHTPKEGCVVLSFVKTSSVVDPQEVKLN